MKARTLMMRLAMLSLLFALSIVPPYRIGQVGSLPTPPAPRNSQLTFIGPDDPFIVYYGSWPNDDVFFKTMGSRYKLIILNTSDFKLPTNIIAGSPQAAGYKQGRIKMLQDQGAMVFAYLSIGEENIQANNNEGYTGDELGPCRCADPAKCCARGFASYYIDDGKGRPAKHGTSEFMAAYVNAGNPCWRARMKEEARHILSLGVTGLFLDTLDTATNPQFEWTQAGMIELLEDINTITPNVIVNRGIPLLAGEFANDYKQFSWAVMFENFYTEWEGGKGVRSKYWQSNKTDWAPKLKGENVLVVDFANCKQLENNDAIIINQKKVVAEVTANFKPRWPNYIADISFNEIRHNSKCVK